MKKTPASKKPLKSSHQTQANPARFGQESSPVRDRMAKEIRTMDPDERIKRGR